MMIKGNSMAAGPCWELSAPFPATPLLTFELRRDVNECVEPT